MNQSRNFGRIADVEADVWDSVVGQQVLCSHGWLRCVEECRKPPIEPVYFLNGSGEDTTAAAVCYRYVANDRMLTPDDNLLGKYKSWANRLGLSALPALVCNPFRSYGRHLMLAPGLANERRAALMETLLDDIEDHARREKLPVMFVNVLDDEIELARLLIARRYRRTLQASLNYIDIVWSSFEEYRKSLKGQQPNKVQREVRDNKKAGITIKPIDDAAPFADRLQDIAEGHYRRHNAKPHPFSKSLFECVREHLGAEATIFGAFNGSELTAAHMRLQRGGIAFTHLIGVEHQPGPKDFTYFNICYYHPIRDSIERGIRRIYYGNQLDHMKHLRGCKNTRTYLYYLPDTAMRRVVFPPLIALHARRAERKVPAWAGPHLPIQ